MSSLRLLVTVAALSTLVQLRPAEAETYAYVGNSDSNEINVLHLDLKSGDMAPVETVLLPGIEKPGSSMPLAVSPDHRFLFAGVRGQPLVAVSFSIDPATGKLTHIGNGPLADSMANIATDRTGAFLFSASYGGNKIAVNPIAKDGKVLPPMTVIDTGPKAHTMQADRKNLNVLASNLGSDEILSFGFDAKTGQLTPNSPAKIKLSDKSGPRHLIFSADDKSVYLIDELDGMIHVFDYDDQHGSLKERQQISALPPGFTGVPWAADIHMTPNGHFLYGSERTSATISAFKLDQSTGQLTSIGSVATETQPRAFNIDLSGQYLAAVGELSNGLSLYRIDQTNGTLTKLASYPVGKKPNWVEFVTFP